MTCVVCAKVFSSQSSANRHIREVHKIEEPFGIPGLNLDKDYAIKCLENDCRESFRNVSDLRVHLFNVHEIETDEQCLEFPDLKDFYKWYEDMCENLNASYISNTTNSVKYFNCNRSGKYNGKTNRKKALKRQGSCKTGNTCTSQIILKKVDNKYEATFYKTHYGHDLDAKHIRIPSKVRADIAAKLKSGMTVSQLLETNRNSPDGNKLSRKNLLTRKDIRNVKNSLITTEGNINEDNESNLELLRSKVRQELECIQNNLNFAEDCDLLSHILETLRGCNDRLFPENSPELHENPVTKAVVERNNLDLQFLEETEESDDENAPQNKKIKVSTDGESNAFPDNYILVVEDTNCKNSEKNEENIIILVE